MQFIVVRFLPCAMAMVIFALVSATVAEAVSPGIRPALDTRAGADYPLSRNAAVDQAGPYADCCYNTPSRRGRGLGYWVIEGIWFVVRWFALLVWGFWPYVLTVIGGIVVLFIGIPLVRKWRAREIITSPQQDGDRTLTGNGSAQQMDFVLPDAADENHVWPTPQSARANEQAEPLIRNQRDDMERERHLQEFRRQQAERQQDWEQRREQLRTAQEAPVPDDTEDTGANAMEPPLGIENDPAVREAIARRRVCTCGPDRNPPCEYCRNSGYEGPGSTKPNFFSFKGSINRRQYWLGMIPLFGVSVFLSFVVETDAGRELWPLLLLWLPVGSYLGFVLMVKRLHDMGESGWMSLCSLIPLFGLLFTLGIGFSPGLANANAYSPAPGQPSGDDDEQEQTEQTAWEWMEREITGPPHGGEQLLAGADPTHQTDFAPPDDGDQNDMQPPEKSARETEQLEPAMHYQRADMEGERERQLQEFRRQQEQRQLDWERRREQLPTTQAASTPAAAEKPDSDAMEPPWGDDGVAMPDEPTTPPAAPTPGTMTRRKARRNLLAPLIASFLTLAVVAGIGLLVAYVALSSSSGTPAPAVVEPTRDLEATIVAAVALAMQPPPATPAAVAQPESSNATPIATAPADARPSPIPPEANPLPSDRLPTVECPGCTVPDQPADGYVEWVRDPKVSEGGVMAFRARIDERAGLVVAGPRCGFPNATLTDHDAFYGAIIPHSMADACGSLPGDWIAEHYTHVNNLLTVRLQIDPLAASHPGLKLCLWTGGMTEKLLDCMPVQQP